MEKNQRSEGKTNSKNFIKEKNDKKKTENPQNIGFALRIIAKKIIKGNTYYKIVWKKEEDDKEETTWEPKENIIDKELIYQYDNIYSKRPHKDDINFYAYNGNISVDRPLSIIRRDIKNDISGDLAVLVKWHQRKNGTVPNDSIVRLSEIKAKYPRLVIKYYENHLLLSNNNI